MEERSRYWIERIAWGGVVTMRTLTSWYLAPIWIFALGVFFGQPWWYCLGLALIFGLFAHRVWRDPV